MKKLIILTAVLMVTGATLGCGSQQWWTGYGGGDSECCGDSHYSQTGAHEGNYAGSSVILPPTTGTENLPGPATPTNVN